LVNRFLESRCGITPRPFPDERGFSHHRTSNDGGAAAFGVAPSARRYLDEYKIRAKIFSAVTAPARSDRFAARGSSMRDSACTGRLENKKNVAFSFRTACHGRVWRVHLSE